jgi:hypothetical protein
VLTITNCTTTPAACAGSAVPPVHDSLNRLDTGGAFLEYPDVIPLEGAKISGVFAPDQSVTTPQGYEGFAPTPPTPSQPLTLVGQGLNRNVLLVDGILINPAFAGLNVAGGLLNGFATRGALAILFELDQDVVGVDFTGFDKVASFIDVYAYARDGSLLGSGRVLGLQGNASLLQPIIFTADELIAGLVFTTDDPSGVAVTNLRYTPVPSPLPLLLVGMTALGLRGWHRAAL